MQGLWSAHRKTKLNLNSPASPGGSPITTPAVEQPSTIAAPDSQDSLPTPPPGTPLTEQAPAPEETPGSSSGKRKVRSSRTAESTNKRTKLSSSAGGTIAKDYAPPTARLSDLGGVEACVEKMLELVAMPLCHPEVYLHTGVQPPRGVLLHGPPGCGKTLLANAMAGVRAYIASGLSFSLIPLSQELGIPFINISAPSIVSGMSGESEKTLRDTFEEAKVRTSRLYEHGESQIRH